MNTWFRKLGLGVLVISLAGVLGGCDDGGGGGHNVLTRIYFGMNGNGDCDKVTVTVDLEAANAILARDPDGALQCVLDNTLDLAGCNLSVQQQGSTLVAVVDNCTIPAFDSPLFSCLFEQVDISSIQEFTSAQCDCHLPNCETDPPICVSPDPEPGSCENCTNGIDDDGNGYTDCNDPNCRYSPDCHHDEDCNNGVDDDGDNLVDCADPDCVEAPNCPATTTTTTSSSTTSTTQSSTTTSTTITTTTSTTTSTIPLDQDCRIVFRVNDEVSVGALQWDTDYASAPGQFPGTADGVDCAALPGAGDAGDFWSANDKDLAKVLTIAMTGVDGFVGPVDIFECRFKASVVPVPADFDVTVVDASHPDGTKILPLPPVTVKITCQGPTTTTTTQGPITTTTQSPVTTTTEVAPGSFYVAFSLTNSVKFGALGLDIGYQNAPGEFTGTAENVVCYVGTCKLSANNGTPCNDDSECTDTGDGNFFCNGNIPASASALAAFNDKDAQKTLSLAWASASGVQGPRNPLVSCRFDATSLPVLPENFPVTITDAKDKEGVVLDPQPTISVTVTPIP